MDAMTDLEILSRKVEALRCLFPALTNKVYMNFGAQGVMAKRTLAAIQEQYGNDTLRVTAENGAAGLEDIPGVEQVRDLGQIQELRLGLDNPQV